MSSIAPSMQDLRKAMNGNRDDDAINGVVVGKSKKMDRWMKFELGNKYPNAEKLFDDIEAVLRIPIQVADSDEDYNSGSKIKQGKSFGGNDYDEDNKCKEDGKPDEIENKEKYPVQVEDSGSDDNDCEDVEKYRNDVIDMVEKSTTGAGRSVVRRLVELLMSASAKTIIFLRTLLQSFPSLLVVLTGFLSVAAAKSFGGSQDLAKLLVNTKTLAARICFSALPYNLSGIAHVSGCRVPFPAQNSTACGLSVHVEDNCLNLFGNTSTVASLYQILVKEGGEDHRYEVDFSHCILDNETLTNTSAGYADWKLGVNLPNKTCTAGKTVTPASNTVGSSVVSVIGSIDIGMVVWIVGIVFVVLALSIGGRVKRRWLKKYWEKQSDASTETASDTVPSDRSGNSEHLLEGGCQPEL